MRLLGVVQWTNRDKHDNPIAGVRPLHEVGENEWRIIDAAEFPSQGQVFWWNAQGSFEDQLIFFRAVPNPGQKDEFTVADPNPAIEAIDLRTYGTATEVRTALVNGIRLPGRAGIVRVSVWCKPDVLLGPVELNRVAGTVKLAGTNLHRVMACTGAAIRRVTVDRTERLLHVDSSAPSGYVDWDDDSVVLRRALEIAVRVAKQSGHDPGLSKRRIEEAARALAAQGLGLDAQLDRDRLERALTLVRSTDVISRSARELVDQLREDSEIKASLDELSAKVRTEVEQSARADLEQSLKRERAALKEATDAHARAKSQLKAKEQELQKAEERLTEIQHHAASAAKDAEAAIHARVVAALDRPLDLLAEVSLLRPFLGGESGSPRMPTAKVSARLDWSVKRGSDIKDKAALRRALTSAARAQGVDPSSMLNIHAAIAARLMPVTLGAGAFRALCAYAQGVCGGRLLIVHVSPSALHPRDFDEVPGGGLAAAIEEARDIDGISLVVLEGANRSPLEASLLPLLQLGEIELSPPPCARGLRFASSLVAGATTVPVTPQLWNHAAAVFTDPTSPSTQDATSGDVVLSSELLAPVDEPTGAIDALLDTWPDCRELRPAMSRFGAVLARFYDEEVRLADALRDSFILPYVATTFSLEEEADVMNRVKDADGSVASALRRLRKRLA
jgi:hypothetical protein